VKKEKHATQTLRACVSRKARVTVPPQKPVFEAERPTPKSEEKPLKLESGEDGVRSAPDAKAPAETGPVPAPSREETETDE
jgi:hypothetical protein